MIVANKIMNLLKKNISLSTTDVYKLLNEKYSFNHIGVVCKKLVVHNKISCFKTKFLNPSYIYGLAMKDCLNYLKEKNLIPEFVKSFFNLISQKGFATNLELKEFGLTRFHFKIIEKLFIKNNHLFKKYNYNSEIWMYAPTRTRPLNILNSYDFNSSSECKFIRRFQLYLDI